MRIIVLDGATWSDRTAFFRALGDALGACPGHGMGFDAFEDSVFYGGMLEINPPFHVIVHNCPAAYRNDVKAMALGWTKQREWKKENCGEDVEAPIALDS